MNDLLKSTLVAALSLQLTGFPLLAAESQSTDDINSDRVKAKLEESFRNAEQNDWSFLNSGKEQVNAAELVASAMKNKEFYAVSPKVDELDARMTVHFKIEEPTTDAISFKLSVLDKNQKNVLSARKFVLSLDPSKTEETKLRFARAFRSMSEEITSKKDQLASVTLKDSTFAAISKISDMIIPSLEAKPMTNTAEMLKVVAGGACSLGVVLLLFGGLSANKEKGKWRLNPVAWITILTFVIGGAAYIGAGIVEDLK